MLIPSIGQPSQRQKSWLNVKPRPFRFQQHELRPFSMSFCTKEERLTSIFLLFAVHTVWLWIRIKLHKSSYGFSNNNLSCPQYTQPLFVFQYLNSYLYNKHLNSINTFRIEKRGLKDLAQKQDDG